MRIYRIADERFPLWDGSGAASFGGRWNSPGRPVIYGSLSYACAMLEILAHANIGRIPMSHRYITADIPSHIAVERLNLNDLPPGWNGESTTLARCLGDQWLKGGKSAVLLVPSVVANLEWNALVNPAHPEALQLRLSNPEPVVWDKRLFQRLAGESN